MTHRLRRSGQVADSLITPGMPGHQEGIEPMYDVAGAKTDMAQALTELGVADAADARPLSFGFNTGAGHELPVGFMQRPVAQAPRSPDRPSSAATSTVLPRPRTAGKFTIARDGWGADYPHANNQLRGLFSCGSGNNDIQYCNPDFDALIAQAGAEPDQAKQIALYNQAQTLLVKDAARRLHLAGASQLRGRSRTSSGISGTVQDSRLPGDQFYETIYITEALDARRATPDAGVGSSGPHVARARTRTRFTDPGRPHLARVGPARGIG